MTARQALDQIVRGLDGVTAGEWHTGCLGSDSKCQCSYVLSESYMGAICTVHVGNGLPIGEGGNDAPPAEEAAAKMRHIARCSPDAIREIAAYVRDLEERLAKAAEALEPFADAADYYSSGVHRPIAEDAMPCGHALLIRHLRSARATLSHIRREK